MVSGFQAGAAASGLKKNGDLDLGLIYSQSPAAVAGVFTTNQVQAAPVKITRERIKSGICHAIVANSGCANCCTGEQGMTDAADMAKTAAAALNISEDSVLVASTGVIGRPLDVAKIEAAMPALISSLSPDGWPDCARAIMTTDTVPKRVTRHISLGGASCSITGIAKGAGMIRPDMATMLCFVCTDAGAAPETLQQLLETANNQSFNRITIDGDTSTNDTVLLMANGSSGVVIEDQAAVDRFQEVLNGLLLSLAKMIVKDGEGATKFIEIAVTGADSPEAGKTVADTVANSSLVKTALFGEDANWGRIMAAIGRSGVTVRPAAIDIYFDRVKIVENGRGAGAEAEAAAAGVIREPEFRITIGLNLGSYSARAWTCDFSIDYVKINADYRT
ncbi:MAG: bifunctional glutamate N-acetyltransferase/amino-acid acetyltransferase ArgJ [Desulfobacterales bacterium]|nr:bifunctional glutamate N-acetyltransferase/amino-acid acetyltransferase ArgJ [Desulfobacterales bacterium]